MFGYASNETDVFMPYPIKLSHDLLKELRNKRIKKKYQILGQMQNHSFLLNMKMVNQLVYIRLYYQFSMKKETHQKK